MNGTDATAAPGFHRIDAMKSCGLKEAVGFTSLFSTGSGTSTSWRNQSSLTSTYVAPLAVI